MFPKARAREGEKKREMRGAQMYARASGKA